MANLVADTEQKSYGALDTYAEHNGRIPARQLCEWVSELAQVARSLQAAELLPRQADDKERLVNALAAIERHAGALGEKITRVE